MFCSSATATMPLTPELARFRRRRLRFRASGPVEKSDSRRCTKKRPPARGQIVSDVVAEVSVPSTGESRESSNGGRSSGRIAELAGRSAERCQLAQHTHSWREQLTTRRVRILPFRLPPDPPQSVGYQPDHGADPPHTGRRQRAFQHAVVHREEERDHRHVL